MKPFYAYFLGLLAGLAVVLAVTWFAYDPPIDSCYIEQGFFGGVELMGHRKGALDKELSFHSDTESALRTAETLSCKIVLR